MWTDKFPESDDISIHIDCGDGICTPKEVRILFAYNKKIGI